MVPRYFQWAARGPMMERWLGGFLIRPSSNPGVHRNCYGSCERRQFCVKKCLKVKKTHTTPIPV